VIREALGSLRDGWVVGIACAAALAYAVVNVIESAITVGLDILDGVPIEAYGDDLDRRFLQPSSTFVLNGNLVYYRGLLVHGALLFVVVLASAAALYTTRPAGDDES
jgi:hypothetical protein